MPKSVALVVLAQRLKQVRTRLGLSQAELGIRMGLPEEIASTRINRYEKGVHTPNLETAERIAQELGVSLSWLVCTDPKLAVAIDGFTKLDGAAQDAILARIKAAVEKGRSVRKAIPRKRAVAKPKGKAPAKKAGAKAKPAGRANAKPISKAPAKRRKAKTLGKK